jgi:hypothetical protein
MILKPIVAPVRVIGNGMRRSLGIAPNWSRLTQTSAGRTGQSMGKAACISVTHRWVRPGDLKLIAPVDSRESRELYSLRREPSETVNLIEEYRDEASRLESLLKE